MDVRRLGIFLAVVDEGGFTAAGDALEISQPAVSQAVRELEEDLGVGLFHRLGRGVALAKSTLAAADIEAGRLVRPIEAERPVDFAYYFVAPRAKLNLPKVVYFRDWLRRQASNEVDQRAVA